VLVLRQVHRLDLEGYVLLQKAGRGRPAPVAPGVGALLHGPGSGSSCSRQPGLASPAPAKFARSPWPSLRAPRRRRPRPSSRVGPRQSSRRASRRPSRAPARSRAPACAAPHTRAEPRTPTAASPRRLAPAHPRPHRP
jgi:hypothetical protein